MAYDVRSMRQRAKQLLALEKRGVVDREKQAKRMGLSIGHVSRIRGWVREHGIGTEEAKHRPGPVTPDEQRTADLIDKLKSVSSTQLTVTISRHLVNQLHAYCAKKDITEDSAVAVAIEHYLKTRPPR